MTSLDPCLPLSSGQYHHQKTPESSWVLTSSDRLRFLLASDSPPVFRNALAITAGSLDQPETLCYAGPAYFDFDSEDIADSINAVQSFCRKLEGVGLDLEAVRLFGTGKKGFHLEIPTGCFADEVPTEGGCLLPLVYRELALELYVDCLDQRVYSCRKGRMWRVPNVRRDNGRFKTPITYAEIMAMTPDRYATLTSAPREFPPLAAPALAPGLASIYDKALSKVAARGAKRATGAKVDTAFKARFGGRLPPSLAALGQGVFPSPVGWNPICFQMGLVAHAIGMDADALVEACRGLIDRHQSDGNRYSTPRKREEELRRMFDYVVDSSYVVSVGGLRSILPKGLRCNDFRGLV